MKRRKKSAATQVREAINESKERHIAYNNALNALEYYMTNRSKFLQRESELANQLTEMTALYDQLEEGIVKREHQGAMKQIEKDLATTRRQLAKFPESKQSVLEEEVRQKKIFFDLAANHSRKMIELHGHPDDQPQPPNSTNG